MKKKFFKKTVVLIASLIVFASCYSNTVHTYRIEFSDGTIVKRKGYSATLNVNKNTEEKTAIIRFGGVGEYEYFSGNIKSVTIEE